MGLYVGKFLETWFISGTPLFKFDIIEKCLKAPTNFSVESDSGFIIDMDLKTPAINLENSHNKKTDSK